MQKKTTILVLFAVFAACSSLCYAAPAAEYLCELGKVYYQKGNYDQALQEFNKALMLEPDNVIAKTYIGFIFKSEQETLQPAPEVPEPNAPIAQKAVLPAEPEKITVAESSPNREDVMADTLSSLAQPTDKQPVLNEPKDEYPQPPSEVSGTKPLKVTGEIQASMGSTPQDSFIWKRANADLNERNYRILSDIAFDRRTDTYDPRIFDRVRVNLDTTNKEGFNFHSNITVDPWSFTGKSDKITLPGVFGDSAEFQLRYWGNTGYTINQLMRTLQLDNSIALPELKVVNGKTQPFTVATNFGNIFNVPGLKIDTQFQPLRELWFDYNKEDAYKVRIFPIAYQDQALSSDDPLGLANHHIWWEESHWLSKWTPGFVNTGFSPVDFTKGKWDNSLSFFTRDSDGTRLTALRGASFVVSPQPDTSLSDTFASPKDLWQDYGSVDNIINAMRLKHKLTDNISLGALYTFRMGFDADQNTDALNHMWGFDAGFSPWQGQKLNLEVATSRSHDDITTPAFTTEKQGNVYYLSYFGTTQDQDVMDLKWGYDEIKADPNSVSFFSKYKFYAARMDNGFDPTLSNFRNTRNDSFWSRHLHFRTPQQYFYQGLYFPSLKFDDIAPSAIGDGIDIGRDVLGFRIETASSDRKLENLFDVRNVHQIDGKYVETVGRDEATFKVTDKLTAKGLALRQEMPKTETNVDPFIYDGNTGEYLFNNTIKGGDDPSLGTGSVGLEYAFTDWLALNGIYERTNDSSLAYGNFPRGDLNGSSVTVASQNDMLFRNDVPFLFDQGLFPLPPYDYYNIFKTGLRFNPMDKMEIYLDYTRNEFKSAGQVDDNINHIGFEFTYAPTPKFSFYFRYQYSRWNDVNRMISGLDKIYIGHHNFFTEFRYLPSRDDEFVMQYGESGRSVVSTITFDPFGGSLSTLDTQHIIRLYYRRKF